jgi:hypothetical protein
VFPADAGVNWLYTPFSCLNPRVPRRRVGEPEQEPKTDGIEVVFPTSVEVNRDLPTDRVWFHDAPRR